MRQTRPMSASSMSPEGVAATGAGAGAAGASGAAPLRRGSGRLRHRRLRRGRLGAVAAGDGSHGGTSARPPARLHVRLPAAGGAAAADAPARATLCGRRRRGRRGCAAGGGARPAGRRRDAACLQRVEPAQDGVDGAVGRRPCGAHQLELQRQPRVAAVAELVEHRRAGPAAASRRAARRRDAACSARARRASSASGAEAGTSPSSRVRSSSRRCPSRSVTSWPRSWPASRQLVDGAQRGGRVARRGRVDDAAQHVLLDDAEQRARVGRRRSTPPHAVASWSSCETASRKEPRALRAISPSASSSASIALGLGDAAQHDADLLHRRPRERERLAAALDRVEQLVRLGRAEHEHDVVGRLLERLQQRVRGVGGERVRLVEDVDLAAAERGLDGDALADLADVVDAAVGGRVELDHVQRGRVMDRAARLADLARRRRRPRRRRGS